MAKHLWFVPPYFPMLTTCKLCGIVKRADGENKPCPGRVRIELRSPIKAEEDAERNG